MEVRPEHLQGDFRAMIETQVAIATKDLELAGALGRPAPGAAAMLDALRRLMPSVYRTTPMEES